MANYLVNDTQLTSVADAIRAKSGGSTGLAFPEGFVTEIGNISTGGGDEAWRGIYNSAVSEPFSVTDLSCTNIRGYAFYSCQNITAANFPSCHSIDAYAFYECNNLTTLSFPKCETIGYAAFHCQNLTMVNFPLCRTIGSNAFANCINLTMASFPSCSTISGSAFSNCFNIISLYLMSTSICKLVKSNAFAASPIDGYTASTGGVYGSIFVPASLVSDYKTASNWSYFSERFVGVE